MEDSRLSIIQDLIRIRGKVFDLEGKSATFEMISELIDSLKRETAKEGAKGEPLHSA